MDSNVAMERYRRGQLAERIKQEVDGLLGKQEEVAINAVMSRLRAGETLDPQFAIQQWLAIYSVRMFKNTIEKMEREKYSASPTVGKQFEV